jgi:alpha-tubulin suppressor-like RCC1 family protein
VRSPQRVQGLGRVLDFSVGGAHTCALQEDGALYCWGHNHFGQLGVGNVATCNPLADWQCSATPLRVNLPEVTDVAAGTHHTCAVLRSGRVACWGWGTDHSLGLGREDIVRLPRLLGRINDAREISAGVYHSCVRHEDQRVSCWGHNVNGQTGTSSLNPSVVYPSAVEFRD